MRDSTFFRYSLLSIKDLNLTLPAAQLDRGEGDLPAVPEDLTESRRLTNSIIRLYSHACELREQFSLEKNLGILQRTIEIDRQGLTITSGRSSLNSRSSAGSAQTSSSEGLSHWSYFHSFFRYSLAYDLCTQYEESESDATSLQDAIEHLTVLLKSPTLDDILRQFALEDLSWNLLILYDTGVDQEGLSKAIDYSRTARDLTHYSTHTPTLSPESNLAFYLHTRYEIEQDIGDLDEAIEIARQDLNFEVSLSEERRYKVLAIHTSSLRERHRHYGAISDLEEAIYYDRMLLEYHMSNSDRAIWLSLLADDLLQCFTFRQDLLLLQEAIAIDQEILQLLPVDSQQYEQSLRNLSLDLHTSFAHKADVKTLIDIIRCEKQIFKQKVDELILKKALQCLEYLRTDTSLPTQVLQWWQGGEYIARLSTRQLVHVLAPVLLARGKELGNASKQSKRLVRSVEILKFDLCDSLTSLLKLKEGELNYQILADGGEPDLEPHFIILVSSEGDGEIIPTSPEARNTSALAVTSSRDLRSIVQGVDPMANLISMNPLLTPSVMQLLQLELDSGDYPRPDYRRRCIQILQKLSRTHHVLPPSLFLRNVALDSVSATTGGGFADIWKGLLGEQPVCLKVLRMFLDSDAKMRKKVLHAFCNEALVWRQLDHPNILPLLGVNVSLFAPSFCLISPWMHNGDINRYMRVTPNFDKLKALTEIAAGLRYLHGLIPPVVHGDLRGANILVSSDGADLPRCCLADFGLALVAETQTLTSTTEMRGASRWMAPELIDPSAYEDFDSKRNRLPADIYAFACTVIEIITEKPPFFGQYLTDSAIIIEVLNGVRPPRPESEWFSEDLWDLLVRCWAHNPWDRPSADIVHAELLSMSLSREMFGAMSIAIPS